MLFSFVGDTPGCRDQTEDCKGWVGNGDCQKLPDYMMQNCELSCGFCGPGTYFSFNPPEVESDHNDLGRLSPCKQKKQNFLKLPEIYLEAIRCDLLLFMV